MGWKIDAIFIVPKSGGFGNSEDLIHLLRPDEILVPLQPKIFDEIMQAQPGIVYIGHFRKSIVIVQGDWVMSLIGGQGSMIEQMLVSEFPNSEICAVTLNSTINHWGFALIRNGQKVRIKAGSADSGTIFDLGDPVPEEEYFFRSTIVGADGIRSYSFGNNSDDKLSEQQVGENIVFEIAKRYTSQSIDDNDELLASVFLGFRLRSHELMGVLNGFWNGFYTLGDDYAKELFGWHTQFKIDFTLTGKQFQGNCIDEDKKDELPATVTGYIQERLVFFVKEYPFSVLRKKNGTISIDHSKPGPAIFYLGAFDPITGIISGTWELQHNTSIPVLPNPQKRQGVWEITKYNH